MSTLKFTRSQFGAVVHVRVSPSQDGPPVSRPDARPIEVQMLLDTGADNTTLHVEVIRTLGLAYVGASLSQTIGSDAPVSEHLIALEILDGHSVFWATPSLQVRARHIPAIAERDVPFKGIIGRNVLDKMEFLYAPKCSLSY